MAEEQRPQDEKLDDVEGHRHGRREDMSGDDDVEGHQAGKR